jgi:hypothetical protein
MYAGASIDPGGGVPTPPAPKASPAAVLKSGSEEEFEPVSRTLTELRDRTVLTEILAIAFVVVFILG